MGIVTKLFILHLEFWIEPEISESLVLFAFYIFTDNKKKVNDH